MGQMKHIHHEEIVKRDKPDNPAAEEHYAEQRRHEANKRRQEREDAQGKTVPVAPPVTHVYESRRGTYKADPARDAERFEQACRDADKEAKTRNQNIVVFKNAEGTYLTWEEKWISDANPIEALYTATPPAPKEKK